MKKFIFTAIIFTALSLSYPLNADACKDCQQKQEQKCKIAMVKDAVMKFIKNAECLGLSDEQLAKLKNVKHAAIKDLIRQKADADVIAVDVKSAMYADKIDLKTVNKLIDAKYEAKKKMALTYVKAVSDAEGVLTAEQLSKAKKICAQDKCEYGKGTMCPMMKSSGKFCPITGEPLKSMGPMKGAMK